MNDQFGHAEERPGVGARIATILRRARGDDGRRLTQAGLAKRANLSRATVSLAINKDLISQKSAKKLAAALGVTDLEILGLGAGPPPVVPADQLETYYGDIDRIISMFAKVLEKAALSPAGVHALLEGLEDVAHVEGSVLPPEYWELRRKAHERIVEIEAKHGWRSQ